ncbi:Asp23/Gls24 family envelope stress response protein [Mycobacterium sp. ITM-2016-00318]|uniref:Asp23/Gls24 family envelope stress response protein n=1 Tax=Mycobacterium sp. ITM-2016-00318 TaxID=2099693 RepID=UPI000CF883BA|nr:Asp23/Gls24 family envelope stress response protein [Mycobacterium sp. ITM-2016-00318]WNG91996.1 Asp23/Gls24 family envelope stress response protein [Mycobacterium sp. ITM-2016-00318]
MTSAQSASKTTGAAGAVPSSENVLSSSHGTTTIADTVVSKIAGIAAREVNGVFALGGGGAARMVGQLRERIPGASVNQGQGVSVEVGERQTAVDIDIIAEYGVAMTDLASGIRRNVIAAIERMTGLEVTEVNITVHDVHLEDEDDADEHAGPARVQ